MKNLTESPFLKLCSNSGLQGLYKSHSILLVFIGLLLQPSCVNGEADEAAQLSYYRGYILWKDQLENPGIAYQLDDVIRGMRAAESGDRIDDASLDQIVTELQKKIQERQKKENLLRAQKFLSGLREKTGVMELYKDKLYYEILAPGNGDRSVRKDDAPVLVYEAKILGKEREEDFLGSDKPAPILLTTTIPGFAQGIIGMRNGEKRRLYVHPDLAYEDDGWLVGPNQLMIFIVEVISIP